MSARLKVVPRKPADDWAEFRPEASPRPTPWFKLVLAILCLGALVVTWSWLKPPIRSTVAQIKQAMLGLGKPAPAKKPPLTTREPKHRARNPHLQSEVSESSVGGSGAFEVYLLDGDRFVRVEANSRSVLLNMRTGEATWIYSDTAEPGR